MRTLPNPRSGRPTPRHKCPKARQAAAVKQHKHAPNGQPGLARHDRDQMLLDRRRPAALLHARAYLTHGTCRSASFMRHDVAHKVRGRP